MKYKLLATLMTAFMLIVPMIGFWHPVPPGPGCTVVASLINDTPPVTPKGLPNYYNFTEPVDGYCEDFNVSVWVYDVEDLYGYDIIVDYDNITFNFVSIDIVKQAGWADQTTVLSKIINSPSSVIGWYQFVVTALPPAVGITGDFMLATLKFHIMNDRCPCTPEYKFWFSVYAKLSNSCSGIIIECEEDEAMGFFKPVIPTEWIVPAPQFNGTKVGELNTISVLLKDAVKMTDFHTVITWGEYQHLVFDSCNLTNWYSPLLYAKNASVVLNTDLFNKTTAVIDVFTPKCGVYDYPEVISYINVSAFTNNDANGLPILLNLTYPSETIWLFNVTFTKCDAWYSGAQPNYEIDTETHEYTLETPCVNLVFDAYFTYLTGPCGVMRASDNCLTVKGTKYCFQPVPGDLNGSGHVDTDDLLIIAGYYGMAASCVHPGAGFPPNGFSEFYDLNNDGVIDVYDVVVVAKNFCRTTPGP